MFSRYGCIFYIRITYKENSMAAVQTKPFKSNFTVNSSSAAKWMAEKLQRKTTPAEVKQLSQELKTVAAKIGW